MKKVIHIDGMSCNHCVKRVTQALQSINGISEVNVDLDTKTATVMINNVSESQLKQAIMDAGYEVTDIC